MKHVSEAELSILDERALAALPGKYTLHCEGEYPWFMAVEKDIGAGPLICRFDPSTSFETAAFVVSACNHADALLAEVRYLRAGYDAFLNPDVVCPYSLRKHARAVLDGTWDKPEEL